MIFIISHRTMKKQFRTFIIIFTWIVLWQLAAATIRNNIIFAGPFETLCALSNLFLSGEFWLTIFSSFCRITTGFLAAFFSGILTGAVSVRFSCLETFLEPFLVLLQSVPVASFIILALIWIGSGNLSVFITFVVVFPILYRNVLEGIRQTNHLQMEMAQVFHLNLWKKILYLYRPALLPYLYTGCKIALGMAWKSGIAAEVIGVPAHSIGEKLYMAKIYLSTGELFAWTFVIILVSKAFEKIFLSLLHLSVHDLNTSGSCQKHSVQKSDVSIPALETSGNLSSDIPVEIRKIEKYYSDHQILSDFSLLLKPGEICCLLGPSGRGKTTLLRLLMGLETAQKGELLGLEHQTISAVFQEDRLFDFLTPEKNVSLVCEGFLSPKGVLALLSNFLEPESLILPVSQLSGGMKRRVAVARALAAPSSFLIMDEPFSGLDDATRTKVISLILKYRGNRTLLLVTHQEEDVEKLGGKMIRL